MIPLGNPFTDDHSLKNTPFPSTNRADLYDIVLNDFENRPRKVQI